LTNV